MGKYDHINELTGAENYFQWRRQMMLALQGERLWPHCSDGTDQEDLANLASSIPTPTDWHARMGHPGGEIVKCLPLAATGVSVKSSRPLGKCESCIVAKFPRKPYPPSLHSPTSHMLDLIHSDLCGPFPVRTPHGKLYFIVFLDDYTNLINSGIHDGYNCTIMSFRVALKCSEMVVQQRHF